jgi:hypothetical protein
MRCVNCKRCGVTVVIVPWCDGKNQWTTTSREFLSTGAQRLSWGEVPAIVRTSWDSVCRAVGPPRDRPHVVGQCLPGGGTRE